MDKFNELEEEIEAMKQQQQVGRAPWRHGDDGRGAAVG
jgi:hypothetical protein